MKNKKVKQLLSKWSYWQKALSVPMVIITFISTILSFIDMDSKYKLYILLTLIFLTVVYFIFFVRFTSKLESITLNIEGSLLEVSEGDIFNQDNDNFKVIGFNEFFDTQVDDEIISSNSLHGQYLLKKYPTKENIKSFNRRVRNDLRFQMQVKDKGVTRPLGGNTTRYELGSIFKDQDYFLVSFSKFNDKNEANLKLTEYANCLLKFWDEVNSLYNRQTVVLPLLGSGITRHKDFVATNQELLDVIIWTFKISKVKFREPSKVKILIHNSQLETINFYKLKEFETNGI